MFDPAIHGHTPGPTVTPPAPPGRLPYLTEGLATQRELSATLQGLQRGPGWRQVTAAQTHLVSWLTTAAARHSAALTLGTPTQPVGTPSPAPQQSPRISPKAGVTWPGLLATLRKGGHDHLARARATTGPTSAMWAALATHALVVAAVPTGTQPRSHQLYASGLEPVDEIAGLRAVIAGVHALVFAAELALVPLQRTGPEYARITGLWTKWQRTRDDLTTLVRQVGGEAPGSKEPYDVRPPASAAAAVALMARLEGRLLPACGAWIAASDKTRIQALNLLLGTATSAAQLGGELQVWPGWPAP